MGPLSVHQATFNNLLNLSFFCGIFFCFREVAGIDVRPRQAYFGVCRNLSWILGTHSNFKRQWETLVYQNLLEEHALLKIKWRFNPMNLSPERMGEHLRNRIFEKNCFKNLLYQEFYIQKQDSNQWMQVGYLLQKVKKSSFVIKNLRLMKFWLNSVLLFSILFLNSVIQNTILPPISPVLQWLKRMLFQNQPLICP